MIEKTTYTELWENDFLEGLYKRFSIIVKPFETPLLEIMIKKINENFKTRDTITMFEIGSGSGQHTENIFKGIDPIHQIHYTGIDVSEKQRNLFNERSPNFPSNITVESYVVSSWQDYSVTEQYDIVVAQHSWYGIGKEQENFEKLKVALNDKGICFILLNPRSNASYIAMEDNGEKPFSSEELEEGLTASNLQFEKIRSFSDTYTKESFCKDGALTELGRNHFSYLYRKDLHGNEQNVIDMIMSTPDEAFRFPTDMFIVTK